MGYLRDQNIGAVDMQNAQPGVYIAPDGAKILASEPYAARAAMKYGWKRDRAITKDDLADTTGQISDKEWHNKQVEMQQAVIQEKIKQSFSKAYQAGDSKSKEAFQAEAEKHQAEINKLEKTKRR